MPSTTIGPGPSIEPPFAFAPLTFVFHGGEFHSVRLRRVRSWWCLKPRLGLAQNLKNCRSIFLREVLEIAAFVFAGQDLTESAIDIILEFRGHRVEGLRVDQVTEWIPQQSMLEI